MSVAGSQRQTYLRLVEGLRPHWRQDLRLPERIQQALAREKRFGSRDRRLYRELIYTTLRFLPWIEPRLAADPDEAATVVAWLAADLPATRRYRAELLAGWPECPDAVAGKAAHLGQDPAALVPGWLAAECPDALAPAELDALHRRAPLWLRLQTATPAAVLGEFADRGWPVRVSPLRPDAVQVLAEADVTQTDSFHGGACEVQDLGSQLLLAMAGVEAGGRWLDACAGAGGKTLQLARLVGPAGRVTAHDIRRAALDELGLRARRAGLANVTATRELADGAFDGVLVDAPCTGTGTWRRAPHLKAMVTPAMIASHAARQRELLGRFAASVAPGGRLLYATCSLNRSENEAVVADFLEAHPAFAVEPPAQDFGYPAGPLGTPLLPARHDTDGFFVAALRRR